METNKRWWALIILCLGSLMIVLDTTIVNVALPSIRVDLGFSETSLVWVVNAYMLTFGGFMLLGGRLGDLFGHRKLFLLGIILFSLASLTCGIANSQVVLIVARAVQGMGGAVVSAVALSLVMNLFVESADRAKAMGVYGFVSAGGGSIGVLLGGVLTGTFNWHWVFLVNLPIGVAVLVASWFLLPTDRSVRTRGKLDLAGAITITTALMLAVYGVVNGTPVLLLAAVAVLALFIVIESRVSTPLVPLQLFRLRSVTTANVVGVLWSSAMFAWFFISALYLQLVLGYSPLQIGLSFLPANLIMSIFSLGVSAKIVLRFGQRLPLGIGMLLAAVGLAYFARAPLAGQFIVDVFPAMTLIGLGSGLAFNPLLLAAMNDVEPSQSGLASGVVNTSFMMGGALGLAVLASLAAAKTASVIATGISSVAALNAGYQLAFLVGAGFALLAAVVSFVFLPKK